jgi:hypothetical protein
MAIPKKALLRSQLQDLTAGSADIDGSHQIIRVKFIEDSVEKIGYFKKLEPKNHYPELLAKISVATSLIHRLFLGKNCAEERLVFDDKEKLIGTLSIAIDGFKPFNYAQEPVPIDAVAKEQVIPSTKTLIEKNFVAAAFSNWYGDNDDSHPHNNGFAGKDAVVLDFDMFFYWFTIGMKEARPVIGTPKKRVDLSVSDWETFPVVKVSKHYHWSTYKHPGIETLPAVLPAQDTLLSKLLPKQYADPTQFEQLAREPKAHDQKFAVAMKALLTFQPEVTRRRLTELFGEMPLNYTSLEETDASLRALYEKEYPELCNTKTNTRSFVDFMMDMYQKHYDNLYRVVVFYMGCDNNGLGVPLKSTCTSLYRKPSVFRDIESWMKAQNETTHSKDSAGIKYALAELIKRYHQIWRDAYTPTLNELLHSCYQLTNKILYQVSSHAEVTEVAGKKVGDDSLTSSWQLINTMPELSKEKIEPLIKVDKESKLRQGLLQLVEFTKKFHAIAITYYEKERTDLTEEDNLNFCKALKELFETHNLSLREDFFHTSTYATEYNRIAALLTQFTAQVNFKLHLTTTDEQMKDTMTTTVAKEVLPHTHDVVITQYKEGLFQWAKDLKPEDLSLKIIDIIDKHYAPYLAKLSLRHRAQPVKDYLLASQGDSGDNRLAFIFSSGSNEAGALNTLLIQHLTPLMLQTNPLESVRNAVRENIFNKDIPIYAKAIVTYAKEDKRFVHLNCLEGKSLFYKTMYDWVEGLPVKTFKAIVNSALTEYESHLWLKSSRRPEVMKYFEGSKSNALILAKIFTKGLDSSTLNSTLFQKIIAGMKTEISKSEDKQKLHGNRLIMQYISTEHAGIYEALKVYSEPLSHKKAAEVSKAAVATA